MPSGCSNKYRKGKLWMCYLDRTMNPTWHTETATSSQIVAPVELTLGRTNGLPS